MRVHNRCALPYCAISCQERRKRTRLMKTASKLTQGELLEVMALQVRLDERRKTKSSEQAEDEEKEDEEEEEDE